MATQPTQRTSSSQGTAPPTPQVRTYDQPEGSKRNRAEDKQKEALNRDEVDEQIRAHQQRIKERMKVLEHEASMAERTVKDRAMVWKAKAQDNLGRIGAVAGSIVLARLLFGGKDKFDASHVPQRQLTDSYIEVLARLVARRIEEGQDLQQALAVTLRERAPILLRRPVGSSGSVLGTLLKLGLMAGAAYGLDRLVKMQTGRSIPEWVQEQMDARRTESEDEPAYRPVHGTSGAEMPDPDAPRADRAADRDVSAVHGTEGARVPAPEPATQPQGGATAQASQEVQDRIREADAPSMKKQEVYRGDGSSQTT